MISEFFIAITSYTNLKGEPTVLCDLCGRKFHSEHSLKNHLPVTTKFTQIFEKNISTKLIYKLKVHSDEMPYECSHCSKKFKWKTTLQNHIITHDVRMQLKKKFI